MGFSRAVRDGLAQYVTWRGRASRSEYWWFVLFTVLCYVPGAYLTYMLEFPVVLFVWLGLVLPTLSVFVRRLHDTNRSGAWWFLCLIPFGAVVLIVFLCRGGDPEANDYGLPVGVFDDDP